MLAAVKEKASLVGQGPEIGSCRPWGRDGRLVSLLEIMEIFHPALFVALAESLGVQSLALRRDNTDSLPERIKELAAGIYPTLTDKCSTLGLRASVATTKRIAVLLSEENPTIGQLRALVDELYGRLIDEMNETAFFSLSMREAEEYNEPRKDWEGVIARFEGTITDIEEARRCFALERYPASIYHILQVVEAGLIELGKFLKVKDPKSGWTAVCNAMDKTIKSDPKKRIPFEKRNFAFLEQVNGAAAAMKNAWRNKISHAEGRLLLLRGDFSREIAEEILTATRGFMRRLAEGLPPRR